jgi:hypothetical protein
MTATLLSPVNSSPSQANGRSPNSFPLNEKNLAALINGDILLTTKPHTCWGAALTAHLYLPIERSLAWSRLTDYSRWVQYFPAISHSEILNRGSESSSLSHKRLYQIASKSFLFLTAQVEIFLDVLETANQHIQFRLASGSFTDFAADLQLQDCHQGSLMTYTVQATPSIPVPSPFIQQAIQLDFPDNLRHMRQILSR